MGIIWNLHNTPCTFRALQERCDSISPTVLNARLKELRASNLVTTCDKGYCLTGEGEKLYTCLEPLGAWAKGWSKDL